MPRAVATSLARLRPAILPTIIVALLADAWLGFVPGPFLITWGIAMILIGALLRVGTLHRPPIELQPPVRGRWRAFNSPASRVPSHGIQSYGQAYAIDLVGDPLNGARPEFGWWPIARPPRDFPGFGAPVQAPCAGTVVRVHDRERDHRARTSPLGLAYMFTVELFRELFGPNRILGNHIVVDRADGTYVALAHLRRGSIRVHPGQVVTVGERIAECGNSGNSSEPHLHLQAMDHPRPVLAAGVPFRFATAGRSLPVPENGEHVTLD